MTDQSSSAVGGSEEEEKKSPENINKDEDGGQIEIKFSLKVEYLGQTAHSIAFVKREAYSVLELKAVGSENMRHLSSQLQILNLGFVGEDANIFELAFGYIEYSLIPLFNTYKTGPPSQMGEDGKSKSSSM